MNPTPWGLHLLYDAPRQGGSNCIAVDIVAVHGLGANPDHAWVRHKNVSAGVKEDVRWLIDLLPATLLSADPPIIARIFTFNYQSAWLGNNLTDNRLESVAARLLDALDHQRQRESRMNRNLIFIGHSFGGLVIEQAITMANSAGGPYEYIVNSLGGIILLGVPHRGSKSQELGSILASVAEAFGCGEGVMMNDTSVRSMKIFDMVDAFMQIIIRKDLAKNDAVVCFYENTPTDYMRRIANLGSWIHNRTSSIVVEESSAILPGVKHIVLDSDHLKLNKFLKEAGNTNYEVVTSNLLRIAAQAPRLIRDRVKLEDIETFYEIPKRHVHRFIGREHTLLKILEYFSTSDRHGPKILILHALGGQGKSQIALEHCRRSKESHRGIFWINASSEANTIQDFERIAAFLNTTLSANIDSREQKVNFVLKTLGQWRERWLLVFDNFDWPESFTNIKDFFPTDGAGDILFTSRNQELGRLGDLCEVPAMSSEEGLALIFAGYKDEKKERDRVKGSEIVSRLGGLALAIDQAASYISYRKIALGDFLDVYEAQRKKILDFTPKDGWEYSTMQIHGRSEESKALSAFTTWELSFQQLMSDEQESGTYAAHFLTLSAFLDPACINESLFRCFSELDGTPSEWEQLFTSSPDSESDSDDEPIKNLSLQSTLFPESPEITQPTTKKLSWNSEKFWDFIQKSRRLSLLLIISGGGNGEAVAFSLHPLIRDWLQLRQKANARRDYCMEACRLIFASIGSLKKYVISVEQKRLLVTHIDACVANSQKFSKDGSWLGSDEERVDLAFGFANFYDDRGFHIKAGNLLLQALEAIKSIRGPEHPETIYVMSNLAQSFLGQGRLREAEELQLNSLELSKRVLGNEHPNTLLNISNLALNYTNQGRFNEAEKLQLTLLKLNEKVPGDETPDTLAIMSNLAMNYTYQGRLDEAEELQLTLIELNKKVLGDEHPSTLLNMNNLASNYTSQGRFTAAEELQLNLLELNKKTLGDEHPNTLLNISNLAMTYVSQGRLKEAEELQLTLLELNNKALGDEHPNTLLNMNNLAMNYTNQGRFKEAEELQLTLLELNKKALGDEHPNTLLNMNNLAMNYTHQGRFKEAEELQLTLHELNKKALGDEHPNTLVNTNNLAMNYTNQGRLKEAEELQLTLLELNKKALGDEHPSTLLNINNLASNYNNQGRLKEAEELQLTLLELNKKALGGEHPNTLLNINNLASNYANQGRLDEAEELHLNLLELNKDNLGDEHPNTLLNISNLAMTYASQGRLKEAEELQVILLEFNKKVLGDDHPNTLLNINNLVETYTDQGKLDEAEELKLQSLDLR